MTPSEKYTETKSSRPFEYILDTLKSTILFSNLPTEDLSCFHNAASSLSYKKDKVLFVQSETAENFYVISSGWVKLFHTLPGGDEVIVDMLTTGNIVGENAIFDHGCYTSSAQIVESVQLLSLPLKLLKEQIHTNLKLAFNMLTSMSQHHRRHYGALALNAMQSAPQRIGCFLLSLCPGDRHQDIVFHLPYDKTLIADTLGMKGATFSRALTILKEKTGLRIKDTRVEIDTIEPLMKFVYGSQVKSDSPKKI